MLRWANSPSSCAGPASTHSGSSWRSSRTPIPELPAYRTTSLLPSATRRTTASRGELAAIRPLEIQRTPHATLDEPARLEADVIVVGSGAGGGVVAAELARAGRKVLVIEAGPYVNEATMPRDELDAFGRLYLNYGLLSTWDGAITMLAGSGVGGGTLVNWMTCLDAPADVRSEWARDHGLDGLDGPEWAADVAAIERESGSRPRVIPSKDELI